MGGRETVAAGDVGGEPREDAAEHRRFAGAVEGGAAFVVLRGVFLRRRDVLQVSVSQTHDQRGAYAQTAGPRRRQHLLPHPPPCSSGHLARERADQPIPELQDAYLGKGGQRAGDRDLVEPVPEQSVQQLSLLRVTAANIGIRRSLLEPHRKRAEHSPALHPRMGIVRASQRGHANGRYRAETQDAGTVPERQRDERASEFHPVGQGAAECIEQCAGAVAERLTDSRHGLARGVLARRQMAGGGRPPLPQGPGERPVERGKHSEHGQGAAALGRPGGRHVAFGPVGEQVERAWYEGCVDSVIEIAVDVTLELPFDDAVNI